MTLQRRYMEYGTSIPTLHLTNKCILQGAFSAVHALPNPAHKNTLTRNLKVYVDFTEYIKISDQHILQR